MATELLHSPLFAVTLTLTLYSAGKSLYRRTGLFLLHPIIVAIAAIIGVLSLLGVEYQTYHRGGRYILFLLGPSVVALGLPLYDRLKELRKQAPAILLTTLFAGAVGIVSVTLPLILLEVPEPIIRSLAPKSVTTPIAISITEATGGIPSLTAAVVVVTGILGAVVGPSVLRLFGIVSGIPFGLAMGNAAHGIGTARALEVGETEGAAAGLAICLNGIVTSVLTPLLLALMLG